MLRARSVYLVKMRRTGSGQTKSVRTAGHVQTKMPYLLWWFLVLKKTTDTIESYRTCRCGFGVHK